MNHHPQAHGIATRHAGNAMVLAIGLIAMTMTMLAVSVQGFATSHATSRHGLEQQKTLAAVEAVLARRELMVVELGNRGDPTQFVRWKETFGIENYGVDYIGPCEVRWKIEPVRTADTTAGGVAIPYIVNPAPTAIPTVPGKQQPNDLIYLFQIAAEARLYGDQTDALGQPLTSSRAQGVRYASVNKQPLFRFVIFYAQEGAKGDLELSHADQAVIRGNVHSNGAIYLGATTVVNTWGATVPSSSSNLTTLGPDADGNPILVTGVDGIFRLAKPLMFGALNQALDPAWSSLVLNGSPPGAWTAGSAYSTGSTLYPTETALPDLTDVYSATSDGTRINPYRVTDTSGFVTGPLTGDDNLRTINGTAIIGKGSLANDSRDAARAFKWNPGSTQGDGALGTDPDGFNSYARTAVTTGRLVRLPEDLSGRPVEVQLLEEVDGDADPTTEEHELAKPLFATATGTTSTMPAIDPVVEAAGKYLQYALGGDTYFLTRLDDGTGWTVTDSSGTAMTSQPAAPGLIIRERPIPLTSIWPGSAAVPVVGSSSPLYMPFAYGKHWRPSSVPFFVADVTAYTAGTETILAASPHAGWNNLNSTTNNTGSTDAWRDFSLSSSDRWERYDGGGVFTVRSACLPGPKYSATATNGSNSGSTYWNYGTNRFPYYTQENWRVVHLRRPTPSLTAGVTATYWNDPFDATKYHNFKHNGPNLTNNYPITTLSGPAHLQTTETSINMSATPGAPINADRFSGRWEAFLEPPSTDQYTFILTGDDQARVWVDDRLVVSMASNTTYTGLSMPLTVGRKYHVVAEFGEQTGGQSCQLKWKDSSGVTAVIPASAFTKVDPASSTFSWKEFSAIQARVLVTSGPVQQKVGLMLRPVEGLSPLQNGRDPYVAALFSPTRGFFTQRRLKPSRIDGGVRSVNLNFVGATDASSPTPADANGEVDVAIGVTNPVRKALVTPTAPFPGTLTPGSDTQHPTSTQVIDTKTPASWSYNTLTSINVGDGQKLDAVRILPAGSLILSLSRQRQVRSATYSRQWNGYGGTLTLKLSNTDVPATQVFLPADCVGGSNRTFYFYNAAMGTGVWGSINGWTYIDPTTVSRYYSYWNVQSNQAANATWVNDPNSSPTTGTSVDFASATEVTVLDPLPKLLNAANQVVGSPTGAEVVALLTANLGGSYRYSSTYPAYPTVAAPVDSGIRPAETGAVPAPGDPTTDPWGGTTSRYISINRGSPTYYGFQDVNPYIVTGATWFPAPVSATKPWHGNWNDTTNTQFIAPMPMTESFQPNLWNGGSAPRRIGIDAAAVTDADGVGLVNHAGRWVGDEPAVWTYDPSDNHVVRIEKDTAAANPTVRFFYYVGPLADPPRSDPAWTELPGSLDVSYWRDNYKSRSDAGDPETFQLMMGLCVQSGSKTVATEAQFTDVKIERTGALSTITGADWDDASGGPRDLSRYLASQYQVLWGIYDITEDFFAYGEGLPSTRLATEDWIFNPREFWSQSRWWDAAGTKEKDPAPTPVGAWTTFTATTYRELFAKTTMLTLNMRTLQDYLKARTLAQAVTRTITGAAAPVVDATLGPKFLSEQFNGLFYAVRTNRYPYNPTPTTANPYGCRDRPLPNGASSPDAEIQHLDDTSFPYTATVDGSLVNLLQPYALPLAPPIRPQDFHHGVRIANAASIDWGYPSSGTPAFGSSKTTLATPNQLFLWGNFNTTTRLQTTPSSGTIQKETPVAVMGDVVTLLSNAFTDASYQTTGLVVQNWATYVTGQGILKTGFSPTTATLTTYNCSILTNNLPTTKASVKEGQGAPFVDTMMFLECWPTGTAVAPTMKFKGSLVVMNSRRYTRAFLLDLAKKYGRTPFGITGWHKAAPDWNGESPQVYSAPTRGFDFNYDLLTEEGTPPFTPFGVTAAGVGGWTKVIQ